MRRMAKRRLLRGAGDQRAGDKHLFPDVIFALFRGTTRNAAGGVVARETVLRAGAPERRPGYRTARCGRILASPMALYGSVDQHDGAPDGVDARASASRVVAHESVVGARGALRHAFEREGTPGAKGDAALRIGGTHDLPRSAAGGDRIAILNGVRPVFAFKALRRTRRLGRRQLRGARGRHSAIGASGANATAAAAPASTTAAASSAAAAAASAASRSAAAAAAAAAASAAAAAAPASAAARTSTAAPTAPDPAVIAAARIAVGGKCRPTAIERHHRQRHDQHTPPP